MKTNCSPFVIGMLVLGTLVPPVSVYAQSGEGNENGHEQDIRPDGRGNRTRGMPPRGRAGLSVTTGNGINYHNGPVLHTVNLYYILYGNWSGLDLNGPALMNSWASSIGGSPYFNINTTYGDTTGNVPNAVTFMGTYTDPGSLGNSLNDNSIATLASNAINSGQLGPAHVVDPNGLYMVLTAPGVNETSGFLTQYCGWHWSGSFINNAITAGSITPGYPVALFSFVGDAAGPNLGNCAAQTGSSPNGDLGVDAMISVMAHELEETATDPQGNAWYDSAGEENGDKCAWTFGSTYSANGAAANMALGGKNYLIQQNWLNAQGGKCVLSWATTPDFSVSVSPGSQTVAPGGTTGNYNITETPSNGFSGTVTYSVSGLPSTATASVVGPAFTVSAGSTSPGSYNFTITGTGPGGSPSHSISATLVVSAPTFTLGITPSSQSVTRPPSGSKSVQYTVKVTPVGAFSSNVSLSASGASTGVTLSLSPTTISGGSGSSTLTVTVTNSASRRTRTLRVTGTSGGTSKQASATITIQ